MKTKTVTPSASAIPHRMSRAWTSPEPEPGSRLSPTEGGEGGAAEAVVVDDPPMWSKIWSNKNQFSQLCLRIYFFKKIKILPDYTGCLPSTLPAAEGADGRRRRSKIFFKFYLRKKLGKTFFYLTHFSKLVLSYPARRPV